MDKIQIAGFKPMHRPIDVILTTSEALKRIGERLGIKADIVSFSIVPGDPEIMSLKIDGADSISSAIPPIIKDWTPYDVASTVLPPIGNVLNLLRS